VNSVEGLDCPLPESVRERLLDAKEKRREAYRHAEHEGTAFNYQKNTDPVLTESVRSSLRPVLGGKSHPALGFHTTVVKSITNLL